MFLPTRRIALALVVSAFVIGMAYGESAMIWRGPISRVGEESWFLATTPEEWAGLWEKIGRKPPEPLPAGMVAVGLFLGRRPTAGYSADITAAGAEVGRFIVRWAERKPPRDAVVAQMITYSWLIRLFDTAGLPVTVIKSD
jgi:hypothetical protein